MYSVKIKSSAYQATRFLTFENYMTAVNCIETLQGRENGYYPEDYFEAGILSKTAKGEVLNDRVIETDFIMTFSYKCID